MTATKTAPKKAKTKAEKGGNKVPPADNGKAEDTRFLESKTRIMNLFKQHAAADQILKDAECDLDEAKEGVKTAQGNVDELTRKLWQTIAEIKNPPPLYNTEALPSGNGKAPAPEMKEDESWRNVPIKQAMPGLGKRIYDGFEAKKLATMGEFCDWRNKDGGANWVTDLPGVGKGGADKIDDAMEAFLTQWRKENPPKSVEPAKAPSDKFEAILDEDLAGFPFILQQSGMASKLAELRLVKVRDLFDAANKDNAKPADWLREKLGLVEMDIVWSSINKRADEVAAKAEKDVGKKPGKKAGNSSQPAGTPLVPEKAGAK